MQKNQERAPSLMGALHLTHPTTLISIAILRLSLPYDVNSMPLTESIGDGIRTKLRIEARALAI
jgi:hypothetical protein